MTPGDVPHVSGRARISAIATSRVLHAGGGTLLVCRAMKPRRSRRGAILQLDALPCEVSPNTLVGTLPYALGLHSSPFWSTSCLCGANQSSLLVGHPERRRRRRVGAIGTQGRGSVQVWAGGQVLQKHFGRPGVGETRSNRSGNWWEMETEPSPAPAILR